MSDIHPQVFLIARPSIDWGELTRYLNMVNGGAWEERTQRQNSADGERLVEFMGRICYRSWAPGLNPNVRKIREDSQAYLLNLLSSRHGSVLEHANYSFVFHNVSRVFTHELVRHRAGTAVSQESLRYVRLTDIPFQHPEFVLADPALIAAANDLLKRMEQFQELVVETTGVDGAGMPFNRKKEITSAARRYAPDGLATSLGWTANIRALRHVVAMRTDPSAEDEIRRIFDQVGVLMRRELPALFADFSRDETGWWRPEHPKV